jgi:hypothetical protein
LSQTAALAGVPGVPETSLSPALLAAVPGNRAPAPWSCVCDAVLWLGRGGAAATAALPPALHGARGLGVVGGMVRYRETPVGPYDEVLGMVGSHTGLRPWGSVAFMAVDSAESLVGGRTNWAMPKTLAAFEGDVAAGSTFTARGADAVRWQVTATSRVLGPAVPLGAAGLARQVFPGGGVGSSRLSARARVRPAVVTVEVGSGGPLASWLRPGRHLGLVVEDARFTLAEPRFP